MDGGNQSYSQDALRFERIPTVHCQRSTLLFAQEEYRTQWHLYEKNRQVVM
jgi:hypothetical protein